MKFTTLEEWLIILEDICTGTEYKAVRNGGQGKAAGIAIVPKDKGTPQEICVYPKPTSDAAIVINKFTYERIKNRINRKSDAKNKIAFRRVPDDEIISICKLLF